MNFSSNPHPQLLPLLEKYDIDWVTFSKKGRPPAGVREKRSAIVTELHSSGMQWEEMFRVTGLSNGAIQRLTQAMWNPESRKTLKEIGRKVGASWRGKKRPGQLEKQWRDGVFDFHRGRKRAEAEKAKLRAAWNPERRSNASRHSLALWADTVFRGRLLDFHRSLEERVRRSRAQTIRMMENPITYLRGRSQWVETPKGTKLRVWARSSYEVAAIRLLESDPTVLIYEHEHRVECADGRWILPDFLIQYTDGHLCLVEVKASWVFSQPLDSHVRLRLAEAEKVAKTEGWGFAVWTEKELADAL